MDAAALPLSPRGEALLAAIDKEGLPYPLPEQAQPKGASHAWCRLEGASFETRGPDYFKDKKKYAAGDSLFDVMHIDTFTSSDRIGNLAARPDSWLRRARAAGDKRFYLVVVWVTPALPYVHVIVYLAVNQERIDEKPAFQSLWARFCEDSEAGDKFRNDRWKVIPRVSEGAWMIQKAVGTKPAMLAQKLTHYWILCDPAGAGAAGAASSGGGDGSSVLGADGAPASAGEGGDRASKTVAKPKGTSFSVPDSEGLGPYIESDCDVASSSVAAVLVSMVQSYAKSIVIDIGLAIEPREQPELPEFVLGAFRFSRIDVTRPPPLSAAPADWVLGSTLSYSNAPPKGKKGKKDKGASSGGGAGGGSK